MKIDIVFGTRPEAIKLAMVIKACEQESGIQLRIISTGQHKEMLAQILEWFNITPHHDLAIMTGNQTLSDITTACINKLKDFYATSYLPDVMMVQGDTTTAFACGLAAFYHKIKIAHVEAGLRTYNKWSPYPEEMNRALLSRLADIHFTPTTHNKEALLREFIPEQQIFTVGNTVIDALLYSVALVKEKKIFPEHLAEYFTGEKATTKIVLITGHRRENIGDGFIHICNAISTLAGNHPSVHFIYPVHLNPNVKDTVTAILSNMANVLLIEPLGYAHFIALMERSYCILTDSGGVQEEAPSLRKPVLIMRNETERTEGITAAVVKLVGTNTQTIIKECNKLLQDATYYESFQKNENPYGNGNSSKAIVKILTDTYA